MTIREYYQAVLDAHISPDLDAASSTLLSKLDEKNAKRKATPTKEQKAAADRRSSVLEFLSAHKGEVFTRDEIAQNLEISPAQVTAACRAIGDAVTKSEAKIDKVRRVVYSVKE